MYTNLVSFNVNRRISVLVEHETRNARVTLFNPKNYSSTWYLQNYALMTIHSYEIL